MTRSRVAGRTFGSLLKTLDTVLIETPARRATSSMVDRFLLTVVICDGSFRRRFQWSDGHRHE